jgi:hypothetical protein
MIGARPVKLPFCLHLYHVHQSYFAAHARAHAQFLLPCLMIPHWGLHHFHLLQSRRTQPQDYISLNPRPTCSTLRPRWVYQWLIPLLLTILPVPVLCIRCLLFHQFPLHPQTLTPSILVPSNQLNTISSRDFAATANIFLPLQSRLIIRRVHGNFPSGNYSRSVHSEWDLALKRLSCL